jgi:hypothetical protein
VDRLIEENSLDKVRAELAELSLPSKRFRAALALRFQSSLIIAAFVSFKPIPAQLSTFDPFEGTRLIHVVVAGVTAYSYH